MDHWRDMPWASKMATKSIDIGGVTNREDEKLRTSQNPTLLGPARAGASPFRAVGVLVCTAGFVLGLALSS